MVVGGPGVMFNLLFSLSSRALILGVRGRVGGGGGGMCHSLALGCECTASHVSPRVKQSWENALKKAALGVFLLINPEAGVRFRGGGGVEGLQEGVKAAPDFCF